MCGKLRASPAIYTTHVSNLLRPNASLLLPPVHVAAVASKSRTPPLPAATPCTLLQPIPCNNVLRGEAGAVQSVRAAGIGRSASTSGMVVAADSGSSGARGAFILFEGVDRCGKSTQAKRLVEHLTACGVRRRCIIVYQCSPSCSQTDGGHADRCAGFSFMHLLLCSATMVCLPACARWRRSCGTSRTALPPSAR